MTFALDTAKGSAAVLVARRLGANRAGQAAAGLAAVVGHSWPAWARFRGGKGVATGFGAVLLISRDASGFAIAGGLSALALTRIMSVASLTAAVSAVVGATVEQRRPGRLASLGFALSAAALITLRHAGNIRRLLRGEEPRVTLRRMTKS
jgi:glycerol-3-phosphate acyltransferase PlsY